MPALTRPRQEVFAHGVARGRSVDDAATAAGFRTPGYGARLVQRPTIADRIAEVRRRLDGGGSRDLSGLIDQLIATGHAARALNIAAGMVAARAAFMDAASLKQKLREEDEMGKLAPIVDEILTDEQWTRRYGPPAP